MSEPDDVTIEGSLDDLCAAIEKGQTTRVWDERVVAAQAYLASQGYAQGPEPRPSTDTEYLPPEDPTPGSGKARLRQDVKKALDANDDYPF